jgi:hypothetical protein
MADGTDRIGRRHCARTRQRKPHEEGLQHDQTYRHQNDGSAQRMHRKSGWHENLARGTLARLIVCVRQGRNANGKP